MTEYLNIPSIFWFIKLILEIVRRRVLADLIIGQKCILSLSKSLVLLGIDGFWSPSGDHALSDRYQKINEKSRAKFKKNIRK